MLVVNYKEKPNYEFEFPFRMFISGSSQSGKTFFAEKLLRHNLFRDEVTAVNYRHPDYLDTVPVEWHKTLSVPVSYQTGLPSMEELCQLAPGTCIVLDDLYQECLGSQAIDYLFRVLSGKKKLCVIIMSQRYFTQGKFGMNIRNNCNYTVLMRNTDARVNVRIARSFNVQKQVMRCLNRKTAYPYVFIDATPSAMVSGFTVYEDIFSKFMIVHSVDGMRAYVLAENDFLKVFSKVNESFAELKHEDTKKSERKRKSRESKKRKFVPQEKSYSPTEESDESSSNFSTKSTESSKSTEFSGSE